MDDNRLASAENAIKEADLLRARLADSQDWTRALVRSGRARCDEFLSGGIFRRHGKTVPTLTLLHS
ncbi:hypothetical protein [Methylobacterium isbiliense]|jgi:hypothetical protein|uniref:Uncharacterized protein n=1 Tax=Methylobacterium isbiliense TaxID=315478 RepID=A0ABQ4SM20_9HYPH|nr:hypothetical protein [Methylobacterium isbiliense]MDN3625934.1 hypothetical protein [Methylobacterium isbiliense]GJE04200.1 hypothetical protein GMJLKIPL_6161 [Methylobacterium isbiliense]